MANKRFSKGQIVFVDRGQGRELAKFEAYNPNTPAKAIVRLSRKRGDGWCKSIISVHQDDIHGTIGGRG